MNYLYLHGYISGPRSLKAKRFKSLFAKKGLKLHIPDLNGKNFSDLTLTGQIEIINQIMKDNKGSFTIIGSSMGGYLAAMTAENSARVKKLVLLAPAFGFITDQKKLMGKQYIQTWKKQGFITVYNKYYKKDCPLNYSFYLDANHYEKFRFHRDLPTLIFHGINDETIPFRVSEGYFLSHPESRLVKLHSDHSLEADLDFILEQTRVFLKI